MFETAFRLCHFAVSGTISLIDRVLVNDEPEDSEDAAESLSWISDRYSTSEDLSSRLSGGGRSNLHRHRLQVAGCTGCASSGLDNASSAAPASLALRSRSSRRRVVTLQVRSSSSSSSSSSSMSSCRRQSLVFLCQSGRRRVSSSSSASGRRGRRGLNNSKYIPRLEAIPEEGRDGCLMEDRKPTSIHMWEDSMILIQSSNDCCVLPAAVRSRA